MPEEFKDTIMEEFPKLHEGGGFELLKELPAQESWK